MHKFIYFLALIFLFIDCQFKRAPLEIRPGMIITQSTRFQPGLYQFDAPDSLFEQALLTITGENLELDFSGVEIRSTADPSRPDQFSGLAIKVENGRNVAIKNLKVRGFKVALMASNVDSLRIVGGDLSYNYRQRLSSTREKEDAKDWLSYHANEEGEWLRYGAAVYLENCQNALVKNLHITGGQNGLMLTRSNGGLFYNNVIQFNSGIGIGLYRSSRNQIMHNKLDWNVRGYSHGVYARGQDSAALLCYEQSNENIFAYNSATHSGDGFFLWAGHSAMETGKGGCNDNLIYENDFSYAPTNGVEVTFSRNKVIKNRLVDCRYGIWGGYSYESIFADNTISGNQFGLAIEHGRENRIFSNYFSDNQIGVQLFERNSLPDGWNYAKNKDVRSQDYQIQDNAFFNIPTPLEISASDHILIKGNAFSQFENLLLVKKENQQLSFSENEIFQASGWKDALPYRQHNQLRENFSEKDLQAWKEKLEKMTPGEYAPPRIKDGMDVNLPANQLQGRPYMLVNEWGPYDFKRPSIWLRDLKDGEYIFLLLGPTGNWKAVDGHGFTSVNPKTGTFPATFRAQAEAGVDSLRLTFEFIGEQAITQFGDTLKRGERVPFQWKTTRKR